MTPLSFDAATARAYVGDERARVIEAKAKADADGWERDSPPPDESSYLEWVRSEMERAVYIARWDQRTEKNIRKLA